MKGENEALKSEVEALKQYNRDADADCDALLKLIEG